MPWRSTSGPCGARAPESRALRRYGEVARLLTGRPHAAAEDGAALGRRTLPPARNSRRLRAYGVTEADIPVLVEKAARASSMKANPIDLTPEELRELISKAI